VPPLKLDTAEDFAKSIFPGPPAAREGLHVDFKRQLDAPREAAIDFASFANGDGGTLIYGVEEVRSPSGTRVAGAPLGVDADRTKDQFEQGLSSWARGMDRHHDVFSLLVAPGVEILVVTIPASARLVAVRAEKHKLEGIVYVGRNNHGKYYMEVEEVERRMQSYSPRVMKIRLAEMWSAAQPNATTRGPLVMPVYHERHVQQGKFEFRVPKPFKFDMSLIELAPTHAVFKFGAGAHQIFYLPYELIAELWWQHVEGVPPPGRPAIFIRGHLTPKETGIELLPVVA